MAMTWKPSLTAMWPCALSSSAALSGAIKNVRSSRAISRFSNKLLRVGRTLRSAFSIPSSNKTRPCFAALTGGWSTKRRQPSTISRRCFRSDSLVSRVIARYSSSRPDTMQYRYTRCRSSGPGSPIKNMSCLNSPFCSIHRRARAVPPEPAGKGTPRGRCRKGTRVASRGTRAATVRSPTEISRPVFVGALGPAAAAAPAAASNCRAKASSTNVSSSSNMSNSNIQTGEARTCVLWMEVGLERGAA
mmetsp:Transcript_15420/g.54034  ORF Transcript_15420/g.54034 Transcript_15420/m.54034 type:complete len:246 (-) Transcript_15420:1-738(-)